MGMPIDTNPTQSDLVSDTASAVPEEHYRFALHPGLRQFRSVHSVAKRVGLPDPFFRVHEGPSSSHTVVGGRQLINYSGYNYLDLCGDARVNAAAVAAIAQSGTSVSASRVVSGERPIHGELERAIAKLYDTPAAVVFVSGHATNVSTIGYLFGPRDLIVHDVFIVHDQVARAKQITDSADISGVPTHKHNGRRSVVQLGNRTLKLTMYGPFARHHAAGRHRRTALCNRRNRSRVDTRIATQI